MTVRVFDGVDDDIQFDVGGISGMTYGATAMLVKHSVSAAFQALGYIHNSGGAFVEAPVSATAFNSWEWFTGSASNSGSNNYTTGVWYLVVIRKASGTSNPRFSVYNYSTGVWTHSDGSGAVGDGTAPGAGGTIRHSFQGGTPLFTGKIAARAYWSNTVPWSQDSTGDAAIVASGMHTAVYNWLAQSPSVMHVYDQADPTTAILDESSGGTAVQVARVGTTVDTGDDPAGFSFARSSSNNVSLNGTLAPVTGSANVTASDDVTLSGTLAAVGGSFVLDVPNSVSLDGILSPATGAFNLTADGTVDLNGTMAPVIGTFGGSASADLALAGQLSPVTLSMHLLAGGQFRDIVATVTQSPLLRAVVTEGSVENYVITEGDMRTKWRLNSVEFVDFSVNVKDPDGTGLTQSEVEGFGWLVCVSAGAATPPLASFIAPSVTPEVTAGTGGSFDVAIKHLYTATTKGLFKVFVKFGPTPEAPVLEAAKFTVL